ncbi:MAG TPA: ATP-binding cassette domain-containing protein [Bacteroidales bacterium]|nr:ATP-binding cassette domain-containing protein [Bacteroidales bacterium]
MAEYSALPLPNEKDIMREIIIENAHENNLKNVSLRIPHYQLIAVTGVSGSGKTSLIYDVLCAEGKRLFFENFIGGRMASAKLSRPKASLVDGMFPVMVIDQGSIVRSPRSTVGTLTELYDFLRLLFARLGKSGLPDLHPYRSLFSFNLPDGYCPVCKGLGVQDHIDPALLIADPSKTIREGAFVLTTPNNYIVYSQVTMDVLDQVCRSEGFNVDNSWQDLTDEQKNVVLYGSEKIKVLFGKHPLESRLRWTGITAKPREEDYYKGILPVMEEILRRERNPNIMRFARSHVCSQCNGKRLNDQALSVKLWGQNIAFYSEMNIKQLHQFFSELNMKDAESFMVRPIREEILKRTALLMKLGAGHLSLDRESLTLSSGEAQRIRLANQASTGLRNVLYILDEPSAGLHPSEHRNLLDVMRSLVSAGNTVILVDHDEQSIREADWIIDIGPGAGENGGKVLFNGPAETFFKMPQPESITKKYLVEKKEFSAKPARNKDNEFFLAEHADKNNLRNISPNFLINSLNVITGVSGSGKTSLVNFLIENTIKQKTGNTEIFRKIIYIDSSPIGRTPMSNPATYTGLSDHVRDLLASLPESRQKGYKKGQFSFVVKGGRCESCGGAGVQQIGMHFLGNVEVVCDVCEGKRFTDETLEIKYKGLNIFNILNLTVDEAHRFFEGQKKITAITSILSELGLGYLKLGQPSTTLSGGEAQRVKLATELSRSANNQTLYILDEPTTGLHMADIETLLKALKKLVAKGHTLLCIEHDPAFILQSDWMVDLGPGSADNGGNIVAEGLVNEMINHKESITSAELRKFLLRDATVKRTENLPCTKETIEAPITLNGVETNNLKNIDVSFPVDSITAVTGVSGSGKSSLVYGTLYAESQRRFLEGMSSHIRQYQIKTGTPVLQGSLGLVPAISLQKKNPVKNPRSIVATFTGLYDLYRLMFSRLAKSGSQNSMHLSTAFSFNSEEGACPVCKGLGSLTVSDEDKLVTHPEKPLIAGAMDGSKTGRFYGDPYGQYIAALLTVGEKYKIDFSIPYQNLDHHAKEIAMHGCGDESFDVSWKYKRGAHEGVHRLKTNWPGFLKLVETEYIRKHADARGDAILNLMKSMECGNCHGFRLKPEMLQYTIKELHIGQLTAFTAEDAVKWFSENFMQTWGSDLEEQAARAFQAIILERLDALLKAGLGYISTDRIVGTLSGGEFQRLQLAGLVKAPLSGVAYILDEPSFGLHPKDTKRISDLIVNLFQHGNSVIMVDHSPLLLEKSHQTIELGPGAGSDGGQITYSGSTEGYARTSIKKPQLAKTKMNPGKGLNIKKAHANNLKNIDLEIPSRIMTVITGVSGSGKTSLLDKVIFESFSSGKAVLCEQISGFENFSGLIYIEQPTLGKGTNITTGDKIGISETIARIFAGSDESKKRKYKPSHFISGSREGRCMTCEGTGCTMVSMDFFNDVTSPCERCGGSGFNDKVLEIIIDGKTIFDALQIPFNELSAFFDNHLQGKYDPLIKSTLGLIEKTGLGHLTSGRSLKTLSTGELQRLKLVSGLATKKGNDTLILLDEPTGGLHPKDIDQLIILFNKLIEQGNTMVCVTHEPLLIAAASKTIELGPGGGTQGGRIIEQHYSF